MSGKREVWGRSKSYDAVSVRLFYNIISSIARRPFTVSEYFAHGFVACGAESPTPDPSCPYDPTQLTAPTTTIQPRPLRISLANLRA